MADIWTALDDFSVTMVTLVFFEILCLHLLVCIDLGDGWNKKKESGHICAHIG